MGAILRGFGGRQTESTHRYNQRYRHNQHFLSVHIFLLIRFIADGRLFTLVIIPSLAVECYFTGQRLRIYSGGQVFC